MSPPPCQRQRHDAAAIPAPGVAPAHAAPRPPSEPRPGCARRGTASGGHGNPMIAATARSSPPGRTKPVLNRSIPSRAIVMPSSPSPPARQQPAELLATREVQSASSSCTSVTEHQGLSHHARTPFRLQGSPAAGSRATMRGVAGERRSSGSRPPGSRAAGSEVTARAPGRPRPQANDGPSQRSSCH